jgi:hypothetical protein
MELEVQNQQNELDTTYQQGGKFKPSGSPEVPESHVIDKHQY